MNALCVNFLRPVYLYIYMKHYLILCAPEDFNSALGVFSFTTGVSEDVIVNSVSDDLLNIT